MKNYESPEFTKYLSVADLTEAPIFDPGASNVSEGINLTLNVADCAEAKTATDYINQNLYCVEESTGI